MNKNQFSLCDSREGTSEPLKFVSCITNLLPQFSLKKNNSCSWIRVLEAYRIGVIPCVFQATSKPSARPAQIAIHVHDLRPTLFSGFAGAP